MQDVRLGDEIEHHWRIVSEENDIGVDDDKSILHAKRLYIYMKQERVTNRRWLLCESVMF